MTRAAAASRVGATPMMRSNWRLWPGASSTDWRAATHGSRTGPAVPDSGPRSSRAAGRCRSRFRPMKRARSVSKLQAPAFSLPACRMQNIHGGRSWLERGRRVTRMPLCPGNSSVCTNRLLKARCNSSFTPGASTTLRRCQVRAWKSLGTEICREG